MKDKYIVLTAISVVIIAAPIGGAAGFALSFYGTYFGCRLMSVVAGNDELMLGMWSVVITGPLCVVVGALMLPALCLIVLGAVVQRKA